MTPQIPVASIDPPPDIIDIPEFYEFPPLPLPEPPGSKVTTKTPETVAPPPSGNSIIPLGSGLFAVPPIVAKHTPGVGYHGSPGPVNSGPGNPGSPGPPPGPVNGGPGSPGSPIPPSPVNGGPSGTGSPGPPGPVNGSPGNPGGLGIPPGENGGTGGFPGPIPTGTPSGPGPVFPPGPIAHTPEPGSVVLLLTGVLALGGTRLWRRSSRSKFH